MGLFIEMESGGCHAERLANVGLDVLLQADVAVYAAGHNCCPVDAGSVLVGGSWFEEERVKEVFLAFTSAMHISG